MTRTSESQNSKSSHGVDIDDSDSKLSKTVMTRARDVGNYMKEQGVSGMSHDFASIVEKHPLRSVAIATGLGLLAGRFMRRG